MIHLLYAFELELCSEVERTRSFLKSSFIKKLSNWTTEQNTLLFIQNKKHMEKKLLELITKEKHMVKILLELNSFKITLQNT